MSSPALSLYQSYCVEWNLKNVSSNLRQKYNNAGSNQYLCGNTRRYIFTTLSVLPLDILTRLLLPFSLHASVAFCVVDLISIIIWMHFSLHKQCPVAMIIHFSIILTTTWNWNSTPKADCSEPNSRLISEQQQNTSQWRFSVYVIRSRFISGIFSSPFCEGLNMTLWWTWESLKFAWVDLERNMTTAWNQNDWMSKTSNRLSRLTRRRHYATNLGSSTHRWNFWFLFSNCF